MSNDHEQVHQMIIDDLKEVKRDVKSLLRFKWELIGITTAVSIIVSVGWKLILL